MLRGTSRRRPPAACSTGRRRTGRGHSRRCDQADSHALLSRGVAALRGQTLVVNLPGSPGGCRDGFAVIQPALRHGLELAAGDTTTAHRHGHMSVAPVPLPRRLASLVRIEHTVFALPFARRRFSGRRRMARSRERGLGDGSHDRGAHACDGAEPTRGRGARRAQPAHRDRELPSGALSRVQVLGLCVAALVVFLVAVSQLDPIVRWLWPIPVAMFVVYPYLKRFT